VPTTTPLRRKLFRPKLFSLPLQVVISILLLLAAAVAERAVAERVEPAFAVIF
jgi:hypothetical protein